MFAHHRAAPGLLGLVALGLVLLTQGGRADDLVVVALAPAQGVYRDAFETFKINVERSLGEATEVKLLVGGEAGTEESMLSSLRRGRAQFGVVTVPGISTAVPELGLLMAPYLFESFAEADFVLDEYLTEPVTALFAARGLVFVQWVDSGWWNLFARQAIPTPEDGRGLRLRAASGEAPIAFLQAFQADIIPLPFAEVIPGLQTGLIDGGATNTAMYVAMGMYEHAPHLTLTRHAINPGVVLANKRWFDGLSRDRQRLVKAAFVSSQVLRAGFRQEERDALAFLQARGLTPYQPTDAELASWRTMALPVQRQLVERISGASDSLYRQIMSGKAAFARLATD